MKNWSNVGADCNCNCVSFVKAVLSHESTLCGGCSILLICQDFFNFFSFLTIHLFNAEYFFKNSLLFELYAYAGLISNRQNKLEISLIIWRYKQWVIYKNSVSPSCKLLDYLLVNIFLFAVVLDYLRLAMSRVDGCILLWSLYSAGMAIIMLEGWSTPTITPATRAKKTN